MNKMAVRNYILGVSLLSILNLNYFSNNRDRSFNTPEVQYSIDIVTKIPIDTFNNSIIYSEDTSRIYYFKGFKIYENTVKRLRSVTINEDTRDTVSRNNGSGIAGYYYFILKDNSTEGIFYKSIDTAKTSKMSAEAFLKRNSLKYNFRSAVDSANRNFNYLTRTSMINHLIVDKYVPIKKIDKSYSDTLAFYYFKDNTIYTKSFLSAYLDTVPDYRLFKVVSVNKSFFVTKDMVNEYSELTVSFQQSSSIDSFRLRSIVEKFSSYLQQ